MSVNHYFHVAGIADEIAANDAPYAVGDRVLLDMPAPKADLWVRITGKRCITNNVKTVNVHWEAEPAP